MLPKKETFKFNAVKCSLNYLYQGTEKEKLLGQNVNATFANKLCD